MPESKKKPGPFDMDNATEYYLRVRILKALKLLVVIWIVGCSVWIVSSQEENSISLMRIYAWSFVVFPGFLLMSYFMTWRCPECNKYLGVSTKLDQCPKCSTSFLEQ